MKLMLRPEWRLWPISTFLGVTDLKTGVTVVLLFALLNKVAGVYGLIAVMTGANSNFAQLSLYIYSVLGLVALSWGLKSVKDENPQHTLYFAYFFFLDHIFSTIWTVFFSIIWWTYTSHDGQQISNSHAQEAIRHDAPVVNHTMSDEQRALEANILWHEEKGTAMGVIIISWLAKIYFALLLYSYATHLRKGSYNSIRHLRSHSSTPAGYAAALTEEEDEVDDFYLPSIRKNQPSHPSNDSISHLPNGSTPYFPNGSASYTPNGSSSHISNGSISHLPDFVSAPGRHGRKASRGSSGKTNIPGRKSEGSREVIFEDDGS
ncbi:Inositolphosphorylceramide synthase subunit Kei1-domain-containing protein [Suillus variegatus]|nr:Inositolphosphorylceramide synthase subunit Kei1-domain-containing protein [Suillus variegatus]